MLDAAAATTLVIRLFGPLEVQIDGAPLPRLRSRKGSWLLALLVLRGGHRVDRSWLAELLWPDSSPELAFLNLRSSLNDLRRALGTEAGWLHSPTKHTLCLDLAGASVDLADFDAAIARSDPAALRTAAALYRGPLLEGCAEEWVLGERQQREQALLRALDELAEQALAAGDAASAEQYLRRAVSVDCLREGARRRLMQALAAGGNYAAALATYRELRQLLHRELHASPDPETQALFERLRTEAQRAAQASASAFSPTTSIPADTALPSPKLPGSKGTITLLLTDIEGSTRLWEAQPAAMEAALARHDALAAEAIELHEGTLVKQRGEGDSLFAVFPHALDAAKAALALQRALQTESWPGEMALRVRMALHTGDAIWRDGDYFGPAVNRCSRLRAAAYGGQILLSAATAELLRDQLDGEMCLRDLGECRLKDLFRPERIYQLVAPGLPTDFPPLKGLDTRPHNLPAQLTPLVGREPELDALRCMLQRAENRLVTLTGPGGTGKTRLALQVAADLLEECADGAFFVDLAPLRDPALVLSSIAQVLGVRESSGVPLIDSVKRYLREKQLLLVLDNFEQVLPAAPVVTELLEAAPRLRALVTSRALLRLRGEQEYPVPPLPVPDPKRLPPLTALSQYAAVELFVQRAVNARPGFAVTNENAPAVAEICYRLDGLPLALELAAARLRLFSPEALLARLERRLPLLTGGARDLPARHQTLRDAIAWSYDLLDAAEQRLFRRLSVFAGGGTLEAVDAVCREPGEGEVELLDRVTSLVDNSLLRQDEGVGDETRLGMLETIREYAQEHLATSGEAEAMQRRHAQFFLELAERTVSTLWGFEWGAEAGRELDWLEREQDNLRAVLDWSIETDAAEVGLPLGDALCRFWEARGHPGEGRSYIARLLAMPSAAARTVARARALLGAAGLAFVQGGGQEAAYSPAQESLAIGRQLGDAEIIGRSLRRLAVTDTVLEHYPLARARLEESLAMARGQGDQPGIADSLLDLANVSLREGDLRTARSLLEESRDLYHAVDRPDRSAWAVWRLGHVLRLQGDMAGAAAYYEESLALFRNQGQRFGIVHALSWVGHMARARSDWERARSCFTEVVARSREMGNRNVLALNLVPLATVALRQGNRESAARGYREAILVCQEVSDNFTLAACLEQLSDDLREQGNSEPSVRLLAAAAAVSASRGILALCLCPSEEHEKRLAAVRVVLGEAAFRSAWAAGQAMSLEAAVAYTMEAAALLDGHQEQERQ